MAEANGGMKRNGGKSSRHGYIDGGAWDAIRKLCLFGLVNMARRLRLV
jgi:hypothetical protein